MRGPRARVSGDLALAACACAWGATFPVTRLALADASPILLVAVRFLLASLLLAPFWPRREIAENRKALAAGLVLGALLAAGFALQSWGLTRIGAGRSAFLTAVYVLITPLVEWLWTRRRPAGRALAGAVVAVAGVATMTGGLGAGLRPGAGDLATLAAAVFFALQISCLARALARHGASRLLIFQVAACGALALPAAAVFETPRLAPTTGLLFSVVFLGTAGTAIALGLQAYGQRHASPTRAALLFASEPVWAALLAAWLGETMTGREPLGAALILAGILIGTLSAGTRQRDAASAASHSP